MSYYEIRDTLAPVVLINGYVGTVTTPCGGTITLDFSCTTTGPFPFTYSFGLGGGPGDCVLFRDVDDPPLVFSCDPLMASGRFQVAGVACCTGIVDIVVTV